MHAKPEHSQLQIRTDAPADYTAIDEINRAAFEGDDESRIVRGLRESGHLTLSLVAEREGEVIGHIAFSPTTITAESAESVTDAIGLGPMSVVPELQGSGIGSMLVERGLEMLRDGGHSIVVVLGHAKYYPRFEFAPSIDFGIRWEHPARPEAFMVMELREGALAGVSGVVRYRPEFG